MLFTAALIVEMVCLFFLSRALTKSLSRFFSIQTLSLLFFPGVIIHELSHLLLAAILFVPVGDMEFTPKENDGGIKLGSVEIGKTDPIRRALIGFAPVLAGLVIVVGAVYLFNSNFLFLQNLNFYIFIAILLALIYLLFAVGNTMFSSSRDMEGTVEILIALLLIFGAVYVLGFRPPLSVLEKIFTKELLGVIQQSTIFLLAPIILDIILLGVIRFFGKR